MIPVIEGEYRDINLNEICHTHYEKAYQNLLKNQVRWLNRNGKNLRDKAKKLYKLRMNNKLNKRMEERCCDFRVLEEKCDD